MRHIPGQGHEHELSSARVLLTCLSQVLSTVTCNEYCKFYQPKRHTGCTLDSDCALNHVATLPCCSSFETMSQNLCNMTDVQLTAKVENMKLVKACTEAADCFNPYASASGLFPAMLTSSLTALSLLFFLQFRQ